MSRPDATASAALDARVIQPVFFCHLDIVSDPLRACTAGRSYSFDGTGNPDLDGHTFDGIDPRVVDVGPVRNKDGGADTVTAKLSGIVTLDAELLNLVGDRANWQGRTAQLWRMIRDENGNQKGAVQHYYTGYMTSLTIGGSPGDQVINLSIDSYLAAYSSASNRTYLDQDQFDPGDQSARAAIAIANGMSGAAAISGTGSSAGGGGGAIDGGGGGGLYNNVQAL